MRWRTRIHNGLRGGTNSHRLLQIRATTASDPSNFRSKSLDVVFLLFQSTASNEDGEVSILCVLLNSQEGYLHTALLDLLIQETLNSLPNVVSPTHKTAIHCLQRSQNIATRNIVVINHLGSDNHLRIPFRKVLVLFSLSSAFYKAYLLVGDAQTRFLLLLVYNSDEE